MQKKNRRETARKQEKNRSHFLFLSCFFDPGIVSGQRVGGNFHL